jgi:hypothetical protein
MTTHHGRHMDDASNRLSTDDGNPVSSGTKRKGKRRRQLEGSDPSEISDTSINLPQVSSVLIHRSSPLISVYQGTQR